MPAQFVACVDSAASSDRNCRKNQSGRTEAALDGRLVDKSLLDRMKATVFAVDSFNRQYLAVFGPYGKIDAGVHGLAVNQDCARAALASFTALLYAFYAYTVAQGINQDFTLLNSYLPFLTVQVHRNDTKQ